MVLQEMNNFNYAQSNSLLKQEISPTSPGGETPQSPGIRIPRWQRDLADQNGLPLEDQDSSLDALRRHSRISIPATVATAQPPSMTADKVQDTPVINTSTKAKNSEKDEKTIPAKKMKNSKHKIKTKSIATSINQTENDQSENLEKEKKQPRSRKPRRSIPDEKEYIPELEQPSLADVVGGRGGRSNHHPGNRPYWIRILESRTEYQNCRSDNDKARIANGILWYVRNSLGGRFLNIDNTTKRWYVLPQAIVLDKIKQALRDKYIPYWAKDIKIEDKVHDYVSPRMQTPKFLAQSNSSNNSNIGLNGISSPSFNAKMPYAKGLTNMGNIDMFPTPSTLTGFNAAHTSAEKFNNAARMARISSASNNSSNKLDFLLNSTKARRLSEQTAVIPTIDDILKCKVDRMPSFSSGTNAMTQQKLAAAAFANPARAQNPYQSKYPPPPPWMSSIGRGGLPGALAGGYANSALLGEASHGFGFCGNPGAPALPGNTMGPPSLGFLQSLQSLDMRSWEGYMEQQATGIPLSGMTMGGQSFAANHTSTTKTIDMLKSLVGTSTSSLVSNSTVGSGPSSLTGVQGSSESAPKGSTKTDWNAMYAKALSNSKP